MSAQQPIPASSANVSSLMLALLAACVAFQLNASMLGPVLVTIAQELNTNDAAVGFSQTAFFTSAALFSLFLPRLGDMIGRKKVLAWMLVLMTLGTVLAALAPTIEVLQIARVIQGISGPVVPLCLIMLRHEVTDAKRYGLLMGVITAVNGGIAGIDALAGGFLAANYGFRSVFWTITVVALISTVCVMKWAPESKPSAGTRMDWLGVLFLVLSLAGLLTALNEAGRLDQANWSKVGLCTLGALIAFALFWQLEKRLKQPLVATHHLQQRSTWALLLTTILTMTGIFATVNGLIMSYAQNGSAGFGMRADWASVALLMPYALVGWLVGPFTGRLAPSLGYTHVLRLGLIGSILAIALMMFWGLQHLSVLVIATVLLGVCYAGTANIMLNGLGVVLSPDNNPGFLPGMNAGAFHLGAGLSFALLPAIQLFTTDPQSNSGYFNGLLAGLGITVVALAASFLIPRPKTAEV